MSTKAEADDTINMVPLIDTMFFLILFFMLVMKFDNEQAMSALIPTTGGGGDKGGAVEHLPPVTIAMYPHGLERGHRPSWYQAWWKANEGDRGARIRIGGSAPLELSPSDLRGDGDDGLERLHAYVQHELALREQDGVARGQQPVVEIACFSQLPWRYAACAFDAVRAYELAHGGVVDFADPNQLANEREVRFAASRVAHWSQKDLGEELYEGVNRRFARPRHAPARPAPWPGRGRSP